MIRLLRSARITEPHRYYKAVRPCAPHRYSAPGGDRRSGSSLSRPGDHPGPVNGRHYRRDRFPRSIPEPEPSSRHLHAGHHLGSRQVTPRLIPRRTVPPGFDANRGITTRQRWIAFDRLLDTHLKERTHAFSATI